MHKIVILGGGFGGLNVALQLEKRARRLGECEIILVDRRGEHLYTPLLYEVATGFLDAEGPECRGELRGGVCINLEQFRTIIGMKHIHFKRGDVQAIDVSAKTVTINNEVVAYDDLVLALGSETAFYDIPGLEDHAYPLKHLGHAFTLRDRLHACLNAYREGKDDKIEIVVGGAGATGTEFAAELAHYLHNLEQTNVIRRGDWSIRLVDALPMILMNFSDDLRGLALKRLASLGVTVATDTKIKSVTDTSLTVEHGGKEERWSTDVTVWCGGIKPASVLASLQLPKGPKGHLMVDEMLQVRGVNNVYSLGDCAQMGSDGTVAPALAQAAIKEAGALAENLVRHRGGDKMVPWHVPNAWHSLLPMGGKYAIGKIGSITVKGWLGYMLRKIVDLAYWKNVLPLRYAFKVWTRGAMTYMKND